MNGWIASLNDLRCDGTPAVLVTVAHSKGSVPRETGTKMVVTADQYFGTIGGGNLEYQAIDFAREQLARGVSSSRAYERYPLGLKLGQCCGGVAELMFERVEPHASEWVESLYATIRSGNNAVLVTNIDPSSDSAGAGKFVVTNDTDHNALNMQVERQSVLSTARELLARDNVDACISVDSFLFERCVANEFFIVVFGAGHVGKALVNVLSDLPCHVTWIDSRAEEFPEALTGNVSKKICDTPENIVDEIPADSYFVVMTHSHPVDQAITERILKRNDFSYCGLIGSKSKRLQFKKRLLVNGVTAAALDRLICPIGQQVSTGKHPAEIAIAVAGELLETRAREQRRHSLSFSGSTKAHAL